MIQNIDDFYIYKNIKNGKYLKITTDLIISETDNLSDIDVIYKNINNNQNIHFFDNEYCLIELKKEIRKKKINNLLKNNLNK